MESGVNAGSGIPCFYSGIVLHLPSFINGNSDFSPEGIGIMPDFWATNKDILKALINVTGDDELLDKLKDINNNL